ncbi:MAG: DinB family protein [Chloroflexi bacterium]|nr:MAG: DinB family protein [Chloroflexota bacterium]
MPEPQTLSKTLLLKMLEESGTTALETLRALPPAAFEQGRYENGWNARQILAHIASIEWAYARLVDLARGATGPEGASPQPGSRPSEGPAQGGIDDYNARQVAKREDSGVTDLIDEFQANRARTIEAVRATDDYLFSVPIRSAGGVTGALADVLRYVAVLHVEQHVQDIAGPASA